MRLLNDQKHNALKSQAVLVQRTPLERAEGRLGAKRAKQFRDSKVLLAVLLFASRFAMTRTMPLLIS